MNPVPWLQMTNMISYQGLVRTFPSGKITEQAKTLIDNKNTETSKYTINFLDGDDLLKLVHESNDSGLIKSYKQHFINHPLKEERKIQKRTLQKKIRDEARCLNIESEL